jgi:hypothetical protein
MRSLNVYAPGKRLKPFSFVEQNYISIINEFLLTKARSFL